jgi:hypothetical protein
MSGNTLSDLGNEHSLIDNPDALAGALREAGEGDAWMRVAGDAISLAELTDSARTGSISIYPSPYSNSRVVASGIADFLYSHFGGKDKDQLVFKSAWNLYRWYPQQQNTWALFAEFAIALANRGQVEQAIKFCDPFEDEMEQCLPYVYCAVAEQYAGQGDAVKAMDYMVQAHSTRGGELDSMNAWAYNRVLQAKIDYDSGRTKA